MPEPPDYESSEKPRGQHAGASDIAGWIIAGVFLLVIFTAYVYLSGS